MTPTQDEAETPTTSREEEEGSRNASSTPIPIERTYERVPIPAITTSPPSWSAQGGLLGTSGSLGRGGRQILQGMECVDE